MKEKEELKSKKGITLIALIITIIILLILAMVTIHILMNQGIIKHAQNATTAYNEAQNNELEYLTYTEGEMDKYAGASSSGSGDAYTPPAEDVDALKKYFMGTKEDGSINEEGQSLINVLDKEKTQATGAYVFEDDEATIGSGSNVSMFMSPYPTFKDGTTYYYIKYKNQDAYRLVVNESTYNVEDVAFVYRPQGLEGETRDYYNSLYGITEKWIVLYDKGDKLELLCPDGYGDFIPIQGKSGLISLSEITLEESIDTYNNAITSLNDFCRTLLKDNTARSVGSNSANPDSDEPGMYTSNNVSNWSDGAYNRRGKKPDNNAEQDFVRMLYHGVNAGTTKYWFPLRYVKEDSDLVEFGIGKISVKGDIYLNSPIWSVTSDGLAHGIDSGTGSAAVRPVVTVAK